MDVEVYFKPTFIRNLKLLECGLQDEVFQKIELFKDKKNYKQLNVHKLKGPLSGRYSFSVNYKIRIVFQYISKKEVVFLAIGDHDVYKK